MKFILITLLLTTTAHAGVVFKGTEITTSDDEAMYQQAIQNKRLTTVHVDMAMIHDDRPHMEIFPALVWVRFIQSKKVMEADIWIPQDTQINRDTIAKELIKEGHIVSAVISHELRAVHYKRKDEAMSVDPVGGIDMSKIKVTVEGEYEEGSMSADIQRGLEDGRYRIIGIKPIITGVEEFRP